MYVFGCVWSDGVVEVYHFYLLFCKSHCSIQKYFRVKREAICPTAEGWPKLDHAAGCTAANLELNG